MIKFFRNPVDTPTTANIEVYQEGDVQRVEATEQMQSALRDASTVIAWVEHGPSVLAVGAVADFLEKQGSAEVSVVEYERDIHPANLAELPVEPTPELVRECLELWRAFCSDDPTVYNVLVELNGIDRWIGGVHLSSEDGQLWWRHDGKAVRRPT